MASPSNVFNPRSKVKVQSTELTTKNMLQKLVEHGCIDLSPWIDPKGYSELPRHGGGYGDIYRGKMRDGRDIAVKVWRRFTDVDTSIAMKRCMREIYTWSKLKHENIHELLGVTQHLGQLGMVSVWMAYGDLWTYILNNPDVNRNPWCIQIATGILYLHTNETVHGDLKASNILLSSDLVAKISDFDSALASDSSMTFSSTGELRNTLRWTAPELLNDSDDDDINIIQKTKESDIYALAMLNVTQRRSPKRPKDIDEFSDGGPLWDLLTRCWNHDPTARPGAQLVLQSLKVETKPPKDKKRAQCNNHLPIQLIFDALVNLTGADFMNPIQAAVMMVNRAGFGDVWKGKLRNGDDIAIKAAPELFMYDAPMRTKQTDIYALGMVGAC
ncbi:unnamed protein product [Rhizoctonia solani]|uniref:Protein kinase domain-containing protein n=1 Tax=Rhizoctonia solani TaxID=456999 RepID=A0A8H3DUZ7_9AGAM|nr:unnamed protein product [Rhizoctonia solani]